MLPFSIIFSNATYNQMDQSYLLFVYNNLFLIATLYDPFDEKELSLYFYITFSPFFKNLYNSGLRYSISSFFFLFRKAVLDF